MGLGQTMLKLKKGNDYWSEAQFWADGTLLRVSCFPCSSLPGSSPSTFENRSKASCFVLTQFQLILAALSDPSRAPAAVAEPREAEGSERSDVRSVISKG